MELTARKVRVTFAETAELAISDEREAHDRWVYTLFHEVLLPKSNARPVLYKLELMKTK